MAWNYYLICIYEKGMRKSRENYKYYKDFETFTCTATISLVRAIGLVEFMCPGQTLKNLKEKAYSKLYCKSL